MKPTLTSLLPAEVDKRLMRRRAVLVDIREPDEFARRHVRGALSRPLSTLLSDRLETEPGREVIFTCRTGMRTTDNCDQLAGIVTGEAFVLEGGVEAWVAAGFPVDEGRGPPMGIAWQAQIAAGTLVLTGVGLGLTVHPGFFGLAAFAGAGLMVSGVSGFGGMAQVFAAMPWNRRAV